jgi:L-asparaginase
MVEIPDGRAPVAGALGPYLDWIVENSRELAPGITTVSYALIALASSAP